MIARRGVLAAAFLGLLLAAPLAAADSGEANPLQPFEKLIGGRWELEGSYQEFEWGVGRKSVVSRSFFVEEGKARQVAEGFWYWHPGEKEIRGVFVAVDMPVELFEYTTRFEGEGRMVSDLRSYDAGGGEARYSETFEFEGGDTYVWTLYAEDSEGSTKAMGGTYKRTR